MTAPIHLLHFADIHIGMENYGRLDPATGTSTRVRDFLSRLDEVIDYALANNVDLVIFAGDAFKTRDPDPTQQREFARRIKRLADAAPTLLLVGNHDLPGMAAKATSLDIFGALDVPRVTVGRDPGCRVVETKRGPVCLAWMPYPMKNRLLAQDEHRGKTMEQLDLALREAVAAIIRDLASQAAAHDMPRVLAGHFTVSEAKFGSERSVMLGRDVAVLKSEIARPVWDYVCFAPSQHILMADGSVRRIEHVRIGDQVVNHTGTADRVGQVTSRRYTGPLYSISAYYLPAPAMRITPDHPVLSVRREQLLCPIPSRSMRGIVCTSETTRLSYPCNGCVIPTMPRQPCPEFVRASELRVGDFLCVPIPKQIAAPAPLNLTEFATEIKTERRNGRIRTVAKGQGRDESVPENILVSEDFTRLCGYFLAEGSLMTSKRHTVAGIQFTFGSHESEYQQDVMNLVRRVFGQNCTSVPNKYGKATTICISSRLLGEMFQSLFRPDGTGCNVTRLPEFMMVLPSALERQVLVGAVRGDGHLAQSDKYRRRGLITWATISETLAWQLWRLALRQGLFPSLRRNVSIGSKRVNPIFTLDLYGTDALALDQEVFGKSLTASQKTKRLCFRDEKFLYVPIRSIGVDEYDGEVWNIEVENSHTYVAGGVAVHNCLGHIHKYQNLSAADPAMPPIVYSGSLERIDFGEEHEPKGFCWVELERGQTRYQFVEVHSRPFLTIHADARSADDPTAAVLERVEAQRDRIADAVVRLLVKIKSEQESRLNEREIHKALGPAYSVTVGKEVEHAARMRLGGGSPEMLTPAQLVERYFKSKDYEDDRLKILVEYAEKVISEQ